ncbi:MAG TPA: folate-binding protein [Anaeromyxobacter sp.]|nr:folate-binding protein [Anaeromyxobacter sp.]
MISADALHAARAAWAVGPVEAPAVLRATGKDAKDYLHRLTTQAVNGLAPGASAYGAILNAKGHLLADAHLLVEEDGVLLVLDPRAAAEARPHLERFVIMDDVAFEDLSASVRLLPVLGPEASARLGGRGGARRIEDARRGAPALDLLLPAAEADALRAALAAEGAAALDAAALEALRILGGFARYGADMDPSRLPMEAGLTRAAISFTKGCYTGQEVVLRATARGHLQRGLVQLALPPGAGPGTPLSAGGQEVGTVTSAADTPEGRVGLGYLRRAHWKDGERVRAGDGEAAVRRVIVEDGIA